MGGEKEGNGEGKAEEGGGRRGKGEKREGGEKGGERGKRKTRKTKNNVKRKSEKQKMVFNHAPQAAFDHAMEHALQRDARIEKQRSL